jgi:RNA polymerase primary sigma factor
MSLALIEPPTDRSTTKPRRATPEKLSAQEERTLLEQIRQGDQKALERLVLANLGLVGKIAGCHLGCGLSYDDLTQEGIRGLIRACHDFKPNEYEVRFSTYAMYWIRSAIQNGIMTGGSTIRLPNYIKHLRTKYRRIVNKLHNEGLNSIDSRRHPTSFATDHEVASRMGVSLHTLSRVQKSGFERTPFHRESSDREEIAVEETLADNSNPLLDLDNLEKIDCLHEAIERLTPIEAWIIRQRFGLDAGTIPDSPCATATDQEQVDSEPKSTTWIAREYGLSPSTIRRCEASALAKLKESIKKRFGEEA